MQVNSSTSAPKELEVDTKAKSSISSRVVNDGGVPFSTLFSAAEKRPPSIKSVGHNTFRADYQETAIDSRREDDDSTDLKTPDVGTMIDPLSSAQTTPVIGAFAVPSSVDFKISSTESRLSQTGSTVMIQMISHIRGLSGAYQSVQFDIPDHDVSIRIRTVGASMAISLTTADDGLRGELKSHQGDIAQLLRKELSQPTLEFSVDTPNTGQQSSGGGNSRQQHQPQDEIVDEGAQA